MTGSRIVPEPVAGSGMQSAASSYVLWFRDATRADVARAGGKGANLGEMARAGLPVPPGFVVTVEAHRRFVEANGLDTWIAERLARLDVDDPDRLRAAADAIQDRVIRGAVPDDVAEAIRVAYAELSRGGREDAAPVAVRSSGTVEDTAQFSFAGMFASSLGVVGVPALLRAVKECWASGFSARLLFYRKKQGLGGDMRIAAVVQRMVDADRSGVAFTADPATNDHGRLVIEGAWGLGEVVVLGQVTPDRWLVDKESLEIVERVPGWKDFMLTRDARSGETARVDLDAARAAELVLSDDEVRALARLAIRDEAHYGVPQDIEWAMDDSELHIVQTRPITTLVPKAGAGPGKGGEPLARADAPAGAAAEGDTSDREEGMMAEATRAGSAGSTPASDAVARGDGRSGEILLHGLGTGPGTASGRARVLESPDEGSLLQPGEVLVARMTSPDWVPLMRRAAAVVTDAGGMTSHAAIVSRELGIPCIVGTRDGTRKLKTGMLVTVDASDGTVLEGAVADAAPARPAVAAPAVPSSAGPGAAPVTATRMYVNLGEPDLAQEIARRPVDGVGLLRAEFMLLSALGGTHPRRLMRDGRGEELVSRLAEGVARIAGAFHPRPVVYRATDFRSNEFRGLTGGEEFEPHEENPMIGYRGCFRYTREPDLFALEMEALARVRERFPGLQLMIPFVRTGSEFRECRRLIAESPLGRDPRLQIWVMAEVPSVVTWLEEYARLGVTGVSIGSNDLTQLVLGIDRDSEILAPLYDERDPAVLDVIGRIIGECRRLGLTCSICGQAPSVHPEYAERLVRLGIDSISVNPDAIEVARRNVAAAEMRLLLEEARRR